jgi:hypothetical protein
MTELELIEDFTKVKATNCHCKKCVAMCRKSICIGTPIDIAKLILAGHVAMLRSVMWDAGKMYGCHEVIEMVKLKSFENGTCVMLDINEKCMLHNSGLKPTEGKLADCKMDFFTKDQFPPVLAVAYTWKRDRPYKELILLIEILLCSYELTGSMPEKYFNMLKYAVANNKTIV